MHHPSRRLASILGTVAALVSAASAGDPVAPPSGLTVVFCDVGQGDGTVVMGPTGVALVFDGGPEGMGTRSIIPVLRKLGAKSVSHVVASHYHTDHVGGLDEVLGAFSVGTAWDRGTAQQPSSQSVKAYVKAAGSKRKTLTVGQILDLGGGAKARVLAVNGRVLGQTTAPIGGTYQQENAASIVLRVDYGRFSMWLGGDLTGGGLKTYDVETRVANACGDVDVYQANHHGSATSTNANLVARIRPEVTVASAGHGSPYGHPSTTVLNRLNTRSASRVILGTTAGKFWSGFTKGGTMWLTTDGWRYRVTDDKGAFLEFYTDEFQAPLPGVGDLVVSEIHRAPSTAKGEYVELANISGGPLSLRGVTLSTSSGYATLAAPYRLLPGQRLLLFSHGDPATNGGIPFGHCWPYRALSLADKADTVSIALGSTSLDSLLYASGFAGGSGRAAERVDLFKGSAASNFKTATARYGRGDFGTPGAANSVAAGRAPLGAGVETLSAATSGGPALHFYASAPSDVGRLDVLGLSEGSSPGFSVGGPTVPLNPGPLLSLSLQFPGTIALVPGSGLRALRVPLPHGLGLTGKKAVFAHFLLDPLGARPIPSTSKAIPIVFP